MEKDAQIAALGRLCGIAPEYLDNFGVRRQTSLATYQALLTAMEVPWEEPEQLTREISRRRQRPWAGLVDTLAVVSQDATRQSLIIAPWTPGPDLPRFRVLGRLRDEDGRDSSWEGTLPASPPLARQGVHDSRWGKGCRTRLELPLPFGLQPGYYDLALELESGNRVEKGETLLIVAPGRVYLPGFLGGGRRLWGLNFPLYALKSGNNWGIGDFTGLKEMVRWAGELGAAFVGVNPLHARQAGELADPSPYAPSSRVFKNFLYLDLEQVPEFPDCRAAQTLLATQEMQAHKAQLRAGELVDYPAVYRLKRKILYLLFDTFLELHGPPEGPRTDRGREFAAFAQAGGTSLLRFGQYNVLADSLGENDWRAWPREYRRPENPEVAAFTRRHLWEVHGHQYLQWLTAAQLAAVESEARQQGLPFTLYQDLALGAEAGGAETWSHPHLFAMAAAMGAPPDSFNRRGQNWGLPPMIPGRLRQEGYRLFSDILRANLPAGGLLRIDHVLGLFRQFWIPRDRNPEDGAYVHYPARELLAVLALESSRRGALVIGEDLGTMVPRIRRQLAHRGVFSYRVFYFERTGAQQFLAPADYPENAVAAVTTHDLPTLAGFWEGRDIREKSELRLYPQPGDAAGDAAARDRDRGLLLQALGPGEFEGSSKESCPPEVRFGVLEFLARSKSALLEVRLEEIFGVRCQQNLPGTTSQYPNWRRKLPLTMEEMRQRPEAASLAAILNKYRGAGA